MSAVIETASLQWAPERSGSQAVHEPFYGNIIQLEVSEDSWRGMRVQSSAVTLSGLAWGLAILGALASESESVSPVRVLGEGAVQYVSYETPTQSERARRVVALLDQWLADDSGYDEETWPELKESLDRNRLSSRRMFDG